MEDAADLKRIAHIEARIARIETALQTLILRLGINPAEIIPQESPEVRAIRDAVRAALMAGDKVKAIRLYRDYYGVGLKEAQDALATM
jgi:ribosomal protein L7/L12